MSKQEPELARLHARPGSPREPAPPPGMHALGLSLLKDGLLFVPTSYAPERPAPFALVLFGRSPPTDDQTLGVKVLQPHVAIYSRLRWIVHPVIYALGKLPKFHPPPARLQLTH